MSISTKFSPLLLLLLAGFLSALGGAAAASSQNPTPYEVLQSYGLPIGLLPKGVLGYDLYPNTGRFAAYLNGSCSFALEGSYQLRYQPKITGYISRNRLRDLKGVTVKVLFLWVSIVEVARDGGDLDFSVGIASAGFDMSNFEVCPQCGCGIDCASDGRLPLPDAAPSAGRDSRVNLRVPF